VAMYKDRIKSAEPVGKFVNNNVAAFTVTLCLEDDAEAKAVGGFAAGAYAMGAQSLYGKWSKAEGGWRSWYGRDYFTEVETSAAEIDKMVNDAVVCIGDPERCINVIKHWESVGVDQIMCLMQAGRIPHEKVMESIRLFGKHVIPYFNKRAGEQPASALRA
jgi:alkanesulfonate monooxygenase SsuD/methylene tetrahydromethanopterin reductase-like flavin-dependent oxidoreductase (luciferase family)